MSKIDAVQPEALRTELRRLGYTPIDTDGPTGETWAAGDSDQPAVLVPREDNAGTSGYAETLNIAVERVAWALDVPTATALKMLTQLGDEIEMRLVHTTMHGGRLPLLDAPEVVRSFVRLLRGGARAEFRGARPIYLGADPESVTAAMEGIDLLAPAPGSFRLIATSSAEAQLPLVRDDAAPDLSRRAVAAAMRALAVSARVTERQVPDDADVLLPAIMRGCRRPS